MKPYPEYKETGLAWLPKIPKHWGTRKIKYIFQERSEKGYPNEPLLASTQTHGVISKSLYGIRTVEAQKDLHLLKRVRVGDFVISLRSFQGGIEYAHYQGIISPAYTIMIPNISLIDPGYFRYLAKSTDFISLLQTCVTGIREGQNIDYTTLKRNSLPLPSMAEQRQIVRYLEAMTAKINKLIRAKKKQVALLQEQKQAIINQAVTKGLDPHAEMKDSGIDWLGPIPKHWLVQRLSLRYYVQLGKMLDTKKILGHSLVPYLRNQDVQWGRINVENLPSMDIPTEERTRFSLQLNDLLVCEGGEIGRCAIWNHEIPCYYQKALIRLRPRNEKKDFVRFLENLTFAATGINAFSYQTGKSTIAHLPAEKLAAFRFAFPPLDEQIAIVKFLDERCETIDRIILQTEREINLVTEYKNSLISSAVTGQIDLRNITVESIVPNDLSAEELDDLESDEIEEQSPEGSEE